MILSRLLSDRFVRVPTVLLEALLRLPLTGTQWRILLWVTRQTLGWNREKTPFSWYRIANDLAIDRGGAVRAGHKLLRSGILYSDGNEVGLQPDPAHWEPATLARKERGAMTGVSDDGSQRKPMTGIIANDDAGQRKRCRESSLFRRAKDSSKERIKKYKDRHSRKNDDARHRSGTTNNGERRHLAGAARPIPGKYDGLSQN